jgi:hypothetical protein
MMEFTSFLILCWAMSWFYCKYLNDAFGDLTNESKGNSHKKAGVEQTTKAM